MGRKIRSSTHEISDFPHKRSQFRGPWNTPADKKNFQSPADFYFGNKGSDVTLFCHLPPPPHSQDPKLINAPDPYFGKEGNDVTEWVRYVDMARPASRDYYFGKPQTDVTEWLNAVVPAGPNPAGDPFWGRTKSYVTDPSVSPNMTPPGRQIDGLGTMGAMTWPDKSKDDQVPLGQSCSKLQNMLNALARSRRKPTQPKPRPRASDDPRKRNSPGYPVGKSGKEFPPPGWTGIVRKATDWESTYWGKCKSYITDYGVSPTLTPPGRPLLGEQAKEAMTFMPLESREEKIPLGRAVKRMGSPRPHSPVNQSPHHNTGGLGNTTRKLRARPYLTPYPNPLPGSQSPGHSSPPSPRLPPPKAGGASPPKSGQASPPSPAASCGSDKKGNQGNLRWRDQQITGARALESPCCDKKKPRGPPVRPVIPCQKAGRKTPTGRPKKKLAPNLFTQKLPGPITDPHHDVPWFGKQKNSVTDPSVSPNNTPPGQKSRRSAAERAASLARRRKVPMDQPYLKPPRKFWQRQGLGGK